VSYGKRRLKKNPECSERVWMVEPFF